MQGSTTSLMMATCIAKTCSCCYMYDKSCISTIILLLFFIQTTNSVVQNKNKGKKKFQGNVLLISNCRISDKSKTSEGTDKNSAILSTAEPAESSVTVQLRHLLYAKWVSSKITPCIIQTVNIHCMNGYVEPMGRFCLSFHNLNIWGQYLREKESYNVM